MMNSVRLRRFLAVYRHRNFGRAADELNITQPALTKSIQQLEADLSVKLFSRSAQGVAPTMFGEALLVHARLIEAEFKNAEREMAILRGAIKGEVTVGVTPSVASDLVPKVFLNLQEDRPSIRVTIIEGLMESHVPALRRGELDLVIGGWVRENHADLVSEKLMSDQIMFFASEDHPLAELDNVPWASLFDYPWVIPPQSQFWMQGVEAAFARAGHKLPEAAAVTNSPLFIRAMLLRNLYISALPARLLINDTRSGRIVALAVDGIDERFEVMLTYRLHAARPPAFEVFVQTLKQTAQAAARSVS